MVDNQAKKAPRRDDSEIPLLPLTPTNNIKLHLSSTILKLEGGEGGEGEGGEGTVSPLNGCG